MDKVTRQLRLMDLEKTLKYKGYDALGLLNLDALRREVNHALHILNAPTRIKQTIKIKMQCSTCKNNDDRYDCSNRGCQGWEQG